MSTSGIANPSLNRVKIGEKDCCTPRDGDARAMPEGFAPSEFDVLVGWARQNFHHAGNCIFRDLISETVPKYIKATSKAARGTIITDIVKTMQSKSPSGTGFLKLNPHSARWDFIGTDKAKDKVGHALRKAVMSAEASSRAGGSDADKTDDCTCNSTAAAKQRGHSSSLLPSAIKKRKAPEPISILKSGRQAKYRSVTSPSVSATRHELSSLSGLYYSPANTPLINSPTSDKDKKSLGISPVGKYIFDDKCTRFPLASTYSKNKTLSKTSSETPPYFPHGYATSSSAKSSEGVTADTAVSSTYPPPPPCTYYPPGYYYYPGYTALPPPPPGHSIPHFYPAPPPPMMEPSAYPQHLIPPHYPTPPSSMQPLQSSAMQGDGPNRVVSEDSETEEI